MTIRSKPFAKTITYAGTVDELVALATEYADGMHGQFDDDARARFRRAADNLARGGIGVSTDGVRFWADGPDGAPYQGNQAFQPDPDPEWAAAEKKRQAERDNARARW